MALTKISGDMADASLMPAGVVLPFAGSAAPSGWLLCYGQTVSRTTYENLFSAIGTAFGAGDGSTTFSVPDLRGRITAGKDNMGGSAANRITSATVSPDGNTLAASGGAQTHQLSTSELPAHGHNIRINGATVFQNATGGSGANNQPNANGNSTGGQLWDTFNTGSDVAHNNVQPTLILNYIIKV